MTASARASYGERRWTAMSSGKSGGHVRKEIDAIGVGSADAISSNAAEAGSDNGCSHLRDELRGARDIETVAVVVHRRGGDARFDQLDPPPIHDLVVSVRRHGNGPAEVIRDAQTHVAAEAVIRRGGAFG